MKNKYLQWVSINIGILLINIFILVTLLDWNIADPAVFENIVPKVTFKFFPPLLISISPALLLLIPAFLRFKKFGLRVKKLIIISIVIFAPLLFLLFLNEMVIHNNCIYEGKQYQLGDQCPGTDFPGCKCTFNDDNYWYWLSGG